MVEVVFAGKATRGVKIEVAGLRMNIFPSSLGMRKKAQYVHWLAMVPLLLVSSSQGVAARQHSGTPEPQGPTENQQPSPGSPGEPQRNPGNASSDSRPPDAAPAAATAAVPSPDTPNEPSRPAQNLRTYALTSNYGVTLSAEWTAISENNLPPPAPLSPYAPFHLSGNLVLSNKARGTILQFATSNNIFLGHDSYWLDTEVHSPSGSGTSLLDLFFYYFSPPSDACIHEVLTTYAAASRVPPTDGPAYMQVYYSCPLSDTLSDFYAAQVSSGITFQLTDNGTRVLAPVGDFYVAPMEQVDESGLTFFVFEAQGINTVSTDAARRFHLPENAQGGQPDFFWAIGAPSPFPFVADESRQDIAILHVAYARLGVDADAKSEFMSILRGIRSRSE